jgi:hypothetical protein
MDPSETSVEKASRLERRQEQAEKERSRADTLKNKSTAMLLMKAATSEKREEEILNTVSLNNQCVVSPNLSSKRLFRMLTSFSVEITTCNDRERSARRFGRVRID